MNKKLYLVFFGAFLSLQLFADGFSPAMTSQDQPWSVTATVGASKYQSINPTDKIYPVGRIALGNEFMLAGDYAVGVEFGVQNGNNIKLNIPEETLAVLSSIPAYTTLGPMLDLLITAKSDPIGNSLFFAQLKGGVAYRYWEFNLPAKDISRLAGEVQAGFGYPITALANLSLLYQGVLGANPKYQIIADNQISRISTIPSLHAVLLGLSVNL